MHLYGQNKLDTESTFLNLAFTQFLIQLNRAFLLTQPSHDMPASLYSSREKKNYFYQQLTEMSCLTLWPVLTWMCHTELCLTWRWIYLTEVIRIIRYQSKWGRSRPGAWLRSPEQTSWVRSEPKHSPTLQYPPVAPVASLRTRFIAEPWCYMMWRTKVVVHRTGTNYQSFEVFSFFHRTYTHG